MIDPIVYGSNNGDVAEAFPAIRFSEVPPDDGIGSIVRRGFLEAISEEADAVLKIDGDGQCNPEVLPDILDAFGAGARYVLVSRYQWPLRDHPPVDREVLNVMVTSAVNALTGWSLTDACSGYFGCTAASAGRLAPAIATTGYGVGLELLLRLAAMGGRVTELAQNPNYRHGNRKFAQLYSQGMLTARSERAAAYLRVMTETLQSLGYGADGSPLRRLHPREQFERSLSSTQRFTQRGETNGIWAKVFPLTARLG